MSVLVFSCAKENADDVSNDASLDSRSSQAIDVSFDMQKITQIDPDQGDFQDMCIGDIRMLQEFIKLFNVTTTISEEHSPCLEIIEHRKLLSGYTSGGGGESGSPSGYVRESLVEYCNNILTYITVDTTITTSVQVSYDFWERVAKGYLYTQAQVQDSFYVMLDTLTQNGATVTETDFTITITETSSTGEKIISVYNKTNFSLLYTEFKDENGVSKKKFVYEYTCGPNGEIIPKMIYIQTSDTSMICKTPYTKKEWLLFDNYSITI